MIDDLTVTNRSKSNSDSVLRKYMPQNCSDLRSIGKVYSVEICEVLLLDLCDATCETAPSLKLSFCLSWSSSCQCCQYLGYHGY